MTEITEHGEIMAFGDSLLDENGFRRIDSLLTDGRKILIVTKPVIIVKKIIRWIAGLRPARVNKAGRVF